MNDDLFARTPEGLSRHLPASVAAHLAPLADESLQSLRMTDWTEFADGARETWAWYRANGWLR